MTKLTRNLVLMCVGADVLWLQNKLKSLKYYNGALDSNFGQGLFRAVVDFQNEHDLLADGVVGPKTFDVLSKTYPHSDLEIIDNFLDGDEYYPAEHDKKLIWLHHTAGGSRPDWTIHGWNTDSQDKVGTAYVIGRRSSSSTDSSWDGKILRAFDDKHWAYHLGISHNSKSLNCQSVGIEICNYGFLKLKNGIYYNYVNKPVNPSEVVALPVPFRGYTHYEKYTDNQLESTRKLILMLADKHEIKIEKGIYNPDWFEYDSKWFNLTEGLRSHTQVRKDKYDIFPQPEMIQMLNSL